MPAFAGHTTGRADRPHPALGQDLTPSSTTRRVATESFLSRLPAAVRPCGSAAELIGRRVKLFGLGRIGITRWPRESRRRGRPKRGRFRHAPGGRRSRDGEGRSARLARYAATTQWRRSALPTWRPDRVGAIRSRVRSSCLGGAPSLLARPLRSGPPPYLLRSSLSTNHRSYSAKRPCLVWIASRAHRPLPRQSISTNTLGLFPRTREKKRAPSKAPARRKLRIGGRNAQPGSSTLLMTWMTPFDCITFGIVTSALSPLASITHRRPPPRSKVRSSPSTVFSIALPPPCLIMASMSASVS